MGFVIKSSVVHLLISDWKNEKVRRRSYFFIKSNGYSNSDKLVVLKNSSYIKK